MAKKKCAVCDNHQICDEDKGYRWKKRWCCSKSCQENYKVIIERVERRNTVWYRNFSHLLEKLDMIDEHPTKAQTIMAIIDWMDGLYCFRYGHVAYSAKLSVKQLIEERYPKEALLMKL